MLWPFNKYPGTDYETYNWEWLIGIGKKMEKALHDLFSDTGALHQMVDKVLAEHPEWTTTVMDGAISTAKLMNESVTNDKLAEGVGDCWIDDIGLETFRDDQTDRFIATIPSVDAAGDVIKPLMGAEHTPVTPAVYARQIGSTFTGNVGCAIQTTSNTLVGGCIINDNEIIEPATVADATLADNDCGYIAINADRTWRTYPIMTTPETMVNDGVDYAFTYWFRLVENYAALDLSGVHAGDPSENIITGTHPRSAIGFKADNSIVYYCCSGRTMDQAGMTAAEVAAEMVRLGCKAAYMMDGGGSSSFSFKCAKLNQNIDSNGTVDRMVRGSINFVKPDCNNFMADAFAFTGQIRQLTMTQLRRYVNYWEDYLTANLNPKIISTDPLDYSLTKQNLAVDAYEYQGTDETYNYNWFLSIKAGSHRFVFRFLGGQEVFYNVYSSGSWTGWRGYFPISLGHGLQYPGTVPANGTLAFNVTLPRTAPDTGYTPTITLMYGNDCIAWVTSITTTGFSGYIQNLSSADKSPGFRWQAIWTK